MQITTIHYERKRSDGTYGNRAAGLSASVDPGEDVQLALAQLRLWVNEALDTEERLEHEAREREEQRVREEYQRQRAARLSRLDDDDAEDEDDADPPF